MCKKGVIPPLVSQGGKIVANPAFDNIEAYWMTLNLDGSDNKLDLPSGGTNSANMSIDSSGIVAIHSWIGIATSINHTLEIWHNHLGMDLTSRAIHAQTLMGSKAFPYHMPGGMPLFVRPSGWLKWTGKDLAASGANTIRYAHPATIFYNRDFREVYAQYCPDWAPTKDPSKLFIHPYWYTLTEDLQIAASQKTTRRVKIVFDSDFLFYRPTFISDGVFHARIYFNSARRSFSNYDIHSDVLAGNNINHWDFPTPILIHRNTELAIDFTDLSGSANDVFFTLGGLHLKYDCPEMRL